MTLELTIVVPAFDEAHRLAAGMRRFDAAVASGAVDVDRDRGGGGRRREHRPTTAAVAEKLLAALPHHRVVRLPAQPGQGGGGAGRAWPLADRRTPRTWTPTWPSTRSPSRCSSTASPRDDVAVGCRALPDSMVETTYVVRSLMGRLFNEAGHDRHRARAEGHPVRVQGVPDTPAARLLFHLVAHRPVRLRRRDPRPGAPARAAASPRCRCTGGTSRGAPSTRSTTRVRCWPTSSGRGSGLLAGRPCPPSRCVRPTPTDAGRAAETGRPIGSSRPCWTGHPCPVRRSPRGVAVLLALVGPGRRRTGLRRHCGRARSGASVTRRDARASTGTGRPRPARRPAARRPGRPIPRRVADLGPTPPEYASAGTGRRRDGGPWRVTRARWTRPPDDGHPDDADLIEAIVEHGRHATTGPPDTAEVAALRADRCHRVLSPGGDPPARGRPARRPTTPGARTSTSGAGRSTCGRSCAGSTTRSTATGSASSGRAWRRSPPRAAPCSSPTTPAPSPRTRRPSCTASRPSSGRPVYGLADYFFRTIPVVGTLWSRTGGVPAHPDNAYRLLHDQQQLAMVFPEGTKATSKTYADRYRLRRFGRGGFVEIAMRAGVPVVPIAVVGAEESMPIVFRHAAAVAKALNLPYFPVTVNSLLLGPLGLRHVLPRQVQAARPRPGDLRRRAGPGALLAEQGDGRGRERSGPPCRTPSTTCCASGAASGSADPMGRRVLITGLDTFWGGRMAQALEVEAGRRDDPRARDQGARRSRSSGPSSCVPTRSTRSSTGSSGPPRSTPSSTPSSRPTRSAVEQPGPPRDQRHRHPQPAGRGGRRRVVGPQGRRQVVDPRLRARPSRTRRGSARRTPATGPVRTRLERSLLEVESLVRDFTEDNPHLAVTVLRFANVLGTDIITPISHDLRRRLPALHRRLRPAGPVRRGGRRGAGARVRHRPPPARACSTWPARASSRGARSPRSAAPTCCPCRRSGRGLFAAPLERARRASSSRRRWRPSPATAAASTPPGCVEAGFEYRYSSAGHGPELRPGQQPAAGHRRQRTRSTATSRTSSSSSATPPPWCGASTPEPSAPGR